MINAIWITWENQRRNRELSSALGIPIFEYKEIDQIKNPFIKYTTGGFKTLLCILKHKPRLVICQNPSIVLSFVAVCLKTMGFFKVWVDAHYAGLFPANGRIRLLMMISRFIQRHADLVIVTTENLKQEVEANRGRGFVLQDKIPSLPLGNTKQLRGTFNLVFICTYAADEPYHEVFAAARQLPEGVCVYVTGNYQKMGINPSELSPNLVFTGYLTEADFITLLHAADALMDLTTREECLVCGAYEGVSIGKPLILSNTPALRDYFSHGAVYTANSASAIGEAIIECKNHMQEMTRQIIALKPVLEQAGEAKRLELVARVAKVTPPCYERSRA